MFSKTTFQVIKIQKAENINTTTYLNDIADPLHFGDWGGLTTKIIWFISGLGISSLILTGLWISFKRRVRNQKQLNAQKMGVWKYINWLVFIAFLLFMFQALFVRYHVSNMALSAIILSILLLIFTGWYLFDYKIKKSLKKENLR